MGTGTVVRRWSGPFFITGAVNIFVVAAVSLIAGVLMWSANGTTPTTTFGPGETYVVPAPDGPLGGDLLVYAANREVEGDDTRASGCTVDSDRNPEDGLSYSLGTKPVVVDGQTLEVLGGTEWVTGARVTCSGPQAAAMAPFAVGSQGPPIFAKIAAVGFAIFAGGFGLVVLVVGLALRARASSAPHPGARGPGRGPGTHPPGPFTRLP